METMCARTCSGDLRFAYIVNLSSPTSLVPLLTSHSTMICNYQVQVVNSLRTSHSHTVRRISAIAVSVDQQMHRQIRAEWLVRAISGTRALLPAHGNNQQERGREVYGIASFSTTLRIREASRRSKHCISPGCSLCS